MLELNFKRTFFWLFFFYVLSIVYAFSMGSMLPEAIRYVSKVKPAQFMPSFKVATCFITHNNLLLLLQRSADVSQPLTWTTPGGYIDGDEEPQKAILREVREETGLELDEKKLKYHGPLYACVDGIQYPLHVFDTTLPDLPSKVTLSPREHSKHGWFPLKEVKGMPLIKGLKDVLELEFK